MTMIIHLTFDYFVLIFLTLSELSGTGYDKPQPSGSWIEEEKKSLLQQAFEFARIDPDSFMYFPLFRIVLSEFIICAEVIYKPIFPVSWHKEISKHLEWTVFFYYISAFASFYPIYYNSCASYFWAPYHLLLFTSEQYCSLLALDRQSIKHRVTLTLVWGNGWQ